MKKTVIIAMAFLTMFGEACTQNTKQDRNDQKTGSPKTENKIEMKEISPKGYTTFKVSDSVTLYEVTFKNQFKMDVAGHLFIPKRLDRTQKNAAIII